MPNDRIIELAQQINQELLNLALIKEYQSLENKVLNDETLKNIDYELRKAQKEMVENSTKEDFHIYQNKYVKLLDIAKENPLLQNYISLKEELQELLNQVSSLIKKDL